VLVAEDNASGIVFELSGTDEAAAGAVFVRTGNNELLGVRVKRGSGILQQDRIANPLFDFGGGALIDIAVSVVAFQYAALFHGDQIVRMHGVVLRLALRRNFVVRLGEDAIERSELRVEAKGAEREYLGH
jgi:hypothetical protein